MYEISLDPVMIVIHHYAHVAKIILILRERPLKNLIFKDYIVLS